VGYSITGLILLATDAVHAVVPDSIDAVIRTVNDAEEISSLVESIQALLRAGEKVIASHLIRDLKTLISDIVMLYATGDYVKGSASALKEAQRKFLWEIDPERVKSAVEMVEEYAENDEAKDMSDAYVFITNVLELLDFDISSEGLKKILVEGFTPNEALHTALVALVISVGGVGWNDEVED
jgi:hypothetical protein